MHTRYSSAQAHRAAQAAIDASPALSGTVIAIDHGDEPTECTYETWHVLWERENGLKGRPYVVHTLAMNDEGQAPHLYRGDYDLAVEDIAANERCRDLAQELELDLPACEECGHADLLRVGDHENGVAACGQYGDGKCQRQLCGPCFDKAEPCCGNHPNAKGDEEE